MTLTSGPRLGPQEHLPDWRLGGSNRWRALRIQCMLEEPMRQVAEPDTIALDEIRSLAEVRFGDMIKGVVDLERGILLLDADLHADQEASLLADGSKQSNLWGINLYPDMVGDDWLEFDSMINVRPSGGNRSRNVEQAEIRETITTIVNRLVKE